ncbi:MAG: histidine kinase [Solirubrobacteraceae bacterium]
MPLAPLTPGLSPSTNPHIGSFWYRRVLPSIDQRRRVPDLIDLLVVLASFGAFTLPVVVGAADGRGSAAAICVLGALAVLPLIVRRRWPAAVLVAVALVEVATSMLGVRFTPLVSNAGPAVGVAVFTVAERLPRRPSVVWCGCAVLAMGAAALIALRLYPAQDQDFVQLVIAVPAWLLGDAVRTDRDYKRRLAAEARRQSGEREARVRAEERLRVSRDVHDVISHTLGMIAVRSGVARMLVDSQPHEAHQALSAIETASRSALNELRQVLRQIREASPQTGPVEPALSNLGALVDGMRHGGFAPDYRVTGNTRRYNPALETSVYRVVQEALTNIVKHARASHVWVEVHHGRHQLQICVLDDGRPDPPNIGGSGLGLIGMRERVALFDGTLEAGLRPGGGFAVVATFPTVPASNVA